MPALVLLPAAVRSHRLSRSFHWVGLVARRGVASSSTKDESAVRSPAAKSPTQSSTAATRQVKAAEDLKSLSSRVQSINERVLSMNAALQSHSEHILLAKRQQVLMDSRINSTTDTLRTMQGQLVEVERVAGDTALKQDNAELLREQMERRLASVASPPVEPTSPASSTLTEGRIRDMIRLAVSEEVGKLGSSSSSGRALTVEGSDEGALQEVNGRLERLEWKMEVLARRVTQLALQQLATSNVAEALRGTSEAATSSTAVNIRSRIAALIQHAGALPYEDASGATHVCCQQVLISNVPPNMGAAEIRELCLHQVVPPSDDVSGHAERNDGGVLSCVVRRMPPQMAKQDARTHALTQNTATAPSASRRAFEVTFASSSLALCAVKQLHGFRVHCGHGSGQSSSAETSSSDYTLSVEPLVAGDVVAAIINDESWALGKPPNTANKPNETGIKSAMRAAP